MKFLRFYLVLAISLITGFAIAGCGGGGGNNPANNPSNPNSKYFAYLVNDTSILVYSFDPATGSLQSTGKKYTDPDGMYFKAIKAHPSKPYLYATCLNSGKYLIKVFGLSPTTGELKELYSYDSKQFEQIQFSPDGNYLVFGDAPDGGFSTCFAIGADGKLTKSDQLDDDARSFKFSEDGKALYYTKNYSYGPTIIKKIFKYTFSNGTFSEKPEKECSNLQYGPGRFALYNNFIFVKGDDGNLHRFDSDLQESTWVKAANNISGVFTYKNYLYGSYDTIHGYNINSTGDLTEFSGTGYPYETGLTNSVIYDIMTVDPTGKFLYAVDEHNEKLIGYRIESNGRLSLLDLKLSDPTTYFTITRF